MSASTTPSLIIAPIYMVWKSELGDRFDFDVGLSIRRLPDELKEPGVWSFGEEEPDFTFSSGSTFAFFVESSREERRRWRDDGYFWGGGGATPEIEQCEFAMWLAKPSWAIHAMERHFFSEASRSPSLHSLSVSIQPLPKSTSAKEVYTIPDLERAKALLTALNALADDSHLWPGLRATFLASGQGHWMMRLLVLWIAMEAVFGSDDPREIVFRLSQRAALFLSSSRNAAESMAREVHKAYSRRSAIVHGMGRREARPAEAEERLEATLEVEQWVRSAYQKILGDAELIEHFSRSNRREAYLDSLLWK